MNIQSSTWKRETLIEEYVLSHENSIFCLLEISFLHICPIWFIIKTYWEYEYSRIFNLLLWKKMNIQFLYENVLLPQNHRIFIWNYRFTIDTCCDTDFILDNSWTFNLLLERETLIEESCSLQWKFNLLLIWNFIPIYLPHLVYNHYLLGTMMGCWFL
jgi:hypothetical protein